MIHELKIVSININGSISKIESNTFMTFMNEFDIVCLNEIRTDYQFSAAGFKCIRSRVMPGENTRGGVAVLFKNKLWDYVCDITCVKDQVWFSLMPLQDFRFGALYISPRDSPFYSCESLSTIQEQLTKPYTKVLIIGDLNARVPEMSTNASRKHNVSYTHNPDSTLNMNGKDLHCLCDNSDLLFVNHMVTSDKSMDGGLTYKKGAREVSQLDWALCTFPTIQHMDYFSVIKNKDLRTDHYAIAVSLSGFHYNMNYVYQQACYLGDVSSGKDNTRPKIIHMKDVNRDIFISSLPRGDTVWSQNASVEDNYQQIFDTLASASVSAVQTPRDFFYSPPHDSGSRWSNLVSENDQKKIWSAINWRGEWCTDTNDTCPSNEDFSRHFDSLFNPPDVTPDLIIQPEHEKYMPILDDPIQPIEVKDAIKQLHGNKAAGVDGLPPGILKLLPIKWIFLLCTLFNAIFTGEYIPLWLSARMVTIYKKGGAHLPGNYRGISIMCAIAKLYDTVLLRRFSLWYTPNEEQAGATKGRGCIEHILCIRLLIDIARKCKRTLYITFIDYVKAYDKVNRQKLLKLLDEKGCGTQFLHAVASTLRGTTGTIGNNSFQQCIGVRQGSCMSCPLFTFYIDKTINTVNLAPDDDWLGSLHTLLLMDDTAVIATSRENMAAKLNLLKQASDDIGMIIHPSKSKFITVNATQNEPFILDEVVIEHTDIYVYLGTPISNEPVAQQVSRHLHMKNPHVLKFSSFISRNYDAPFSVKEKVRQCALNAAIFYSCETWLGKNLRPAESAYNSTLKMELGVRITTTNELACLEANIPSAEAFIKEKQRKFFKNLTKREGFYHTHLCRIIELAKEEKSPCGVYIRTLNLDTNYIENWFNDVKTAVRDASTTRRATYYKINPTFQTSKLYSEPAIQEFRRISCTRLRLSSHRLRIETGRWSRIPRESRLCSCGISVQTEEHVLLECSETANLRATYLPAATCKDISELFDTAEDVRALSDFCHSVLSYYKH